MQNSFAISPIDANSIGASRSVETWEASMDSSSGIEAVDSEFLSVGFTPYESRHDSLVDLSPKIMYLMEQLELQNDRLLLKEPSPEMSKEELEGSVDATLNQIQENAQLVVLAQANVVPASIIGLL